MKVKIIKPISKFFKVGEVVEMTITNKKGDFILSTVKLSQSFDSDYHVRVKPATFEEFANQLVVTIEKDL